ncbi:AAA family ATPase [Hydrogenophaga crocea]|uniref:AAA family ATPase n=1 Tax=Hydrogenophaga crocea TaxID=2716225 RepID=A0A6G8IIZ4_9BURK|nr:AAA family ATPase [Hydrogenophaga crocea]QIM53202.1 AAA family ATPase [Hydrogenophaga crocea]
MTDFKKDVDPSGQEDMSHEPSTQDEPQAQVPRKLTGSEVVDLLRPMINPNFKFVPKPSTSVNAVGNTEAIKKRRPASFTARPTEGRARLHNEKTFVVYHRFADDYRLDLMLPPGVGEQFDALKERLKKEDNEKRAWEASNPEPAEDRARLRRLVKQEEERREQEQKRLAAERAERDAKENKERIKARLRSMGVDPDQSGFRNQVSKLPASQRLRVYREDNVQRMASAAQSVDSDIKKRNESIGFMLNAKGPWRRLGAPESVDAILALEGDHPHFGEVIQFVANHVALQKMRSQAPGHESAESAKSANDAQASGTGKKARAGKGKSKAAIADAGVPGEEEGKPPVRLPPLLLFGPPGVGKTHFCESLAKVLGVPVRRHPMDQAETSSALLGSDITWGNSRYGLIFDLLGLGEYANPLVILDELDKAQVISKTSGGISSPTGVLHSLLEPVSAANVRDISLDLELDASQITWIATANYPWWVPATLRSRFKEFLITPPDAEQAIQLSRSVVKHALKAAGFGVGEPDKRIVVALAHLSAREIYQVTLAAAATAARRGARELQTKDLPREIVAEEAGAQCRLSWTH